MYLGKISRKCCMSLLGAFREEIAHSSIRCIFLAINKLSEKRIVEIPECSFGCGLSLSTVAEYKQNKKSHIHGNMNPMFLQTFLKLKNCADCS